MCVLYCVLYSFDMCTLPHCVNKLCCARMYTHTQHIHKQARYIHTGTLPHRVDQLCSAGMYIHTHITHTTHTNRRKTHPYWHAVSSCRLVRHRVHTHTHNTHIHTYTQTQDTCIPALSLYTHTDNTHTHTHTNRVKTHPYWHATSPYL